MKDFDHMLDQIKQQLSKPTICPEEYKINSEKFTEWELKLEVKDEEEDSGFEKFMDELFVKPKRIVILGGNETGKTALGFNILENISYHTKRKCYTMGYRKKDLPGFIHRLIKPDFIPVDSAMMVDEAGMYFNSRLNGGKSRVRSSSLMMTARQQGNTMISITQNSAKMDVDMLRFCDVILVKELGMFQTMFERQNLNKIFRMSQECFHTIPKTDRVKYTFVFSDCFTGFVSTKLPDFWSDKLSNGFRGNLTVPGGT